MVVTPPFVHYIQVSRALVVTHHWPPSAWRWAFYYTLMVLCYSFSQLLWGLLSLAIHFSGQLPSWLSSPIAKIWAGVMLCTQIPWGLTSTLFFFTFPLFSHWSLSRWSLKGDFSPADSTNPTADTNGHCLERSLTCVKTTNLLFYWQTHTYGFMVSRTF